MNNTQVNHISGKNEIGLLKLKLLISGLFVEQELAKYFTFHGLSGWLDLILPGNTWVKAPFKVNAGDLELEEDTLILQKKTDSGFHIKFRNLLIPVDIVQTPSFYDKKTTSGRKMSSIGVAYANYLVIAPTAACFEWGHLLQCRSCAYGLDSALATDIPSVSDVVETVGEALKEKYVKNIHLYFGYWEKEDGGAPFFAPYITALKKKYSVLISVQATPPDDLQWVDYLYAIGVDSIAYNLELFDAEILREISPQSVSLINRDKYLKALSRAVKVFPGGTVTSELLVSFEPVESTKKGIDYLISLDVLPTLAILQPAEGCSSRVRLPDVEEVVSLFEYLGRAIDKSSFNGRWIDHFNILLDVEPEYFTGGKRYSAFFAKKFGPALSKLRRAIRVREM